MDSMRDSQLQSSEDAKSTYDVVGDLAPDVLQTPPIELVGGKELFTAPTFSNLFQSSLFAPIACCSAAFVVHTIVRRIKRVPYPPFRSAFKPAEIYGFIAAMQSTNAFNIDHLGLKLEDDDFKFIWMLTISFNKMNNKNFVMEYYEKRYRGPVIDVARETYPSSLARKIAWWTNHVWTTAKRRDAVRFLLSPELNAYGLSPHDIDVCVTHIANAVDEHRWETARWGTLFAAAGLAPVRVVARWVQRPRLNVWALGLQRVLLYGYVCVCPPHVISGVLLPSSLEDKSKASQMLQTWLKNRTDD